MEENTTTPLTQAQILENVIKAVGETSYSFYTKLNLAKPLKSANSIYNILKGENNISLGMRNRIVLAFPNVNFNYMEAGEGEPLLEGEKLQNQKNFFNIGDQKPGGDLMMFAKMPYMLQELVELQREANEKQEATNELLDKIHTELLNNRK